jgi:terminase, large subunit
MTVIHREIKILPSLPDAVRAMLPGREVSLALPRNVRARLRHPEKIRVSDHAERYRVVTDGAHVGPWRHEYAPHTVKIMDTFGLPWVREVWFLGVEQSGKTNTMLNCMGWCIDCDPGNIYYLMPTEDTSAKVTGKRIIPMIKKTPRLSRYWSGRENDLTLSVIGLEHGVSIFPAHANSASSMATFTAKYCFGDEIDKYPDAAGREADPITLIRKRNRTYRGSYKRFFSSTPAGKFICKGTFACDQVWEMRLRCPHCQELIRMNVAGLIIPDGAADDAALLSGVRYACSSCGAQWDERARRRAIIGGAWYCIKGEDKGRPESVGFHHRSWECLDIPLAEIAAAYLLAKTGSITDKIAWANGYEALDYIEEQQERTEDAIMRLVDDAMPRGVCSRDPACLVILADTQQIGFYYQVWAYGWGRDLETWRIEIGYVEHFEHLAQIAAREWPDADGKIHRIGCGFIDSGGGTNPFQPKHSRTAEVYEFCRRNPLFRPLKGYREKAQPWTTTKIDFYPSRDGKKVPIPGGLVLYLIHVTLYKDELSRKLQIEPTDPGAFHLHAGTDVEYARQMCAEYKDERGWWHCPRHKANHHWDIGVYGMAVADILNVKNMARDVAVQPRRRILSRGVKIET